MSVLLQQLSAEMADAVLRVRRVLVRIRSGRGDGAGIVVHPDGLIVTNAHVVGHGQVEVTLPDGSSVPGEVLAHDTDLDLAAVSVRGGGLLAIELADSRRLQPGEWVFALGHPWGVAGAVTAGVVTHVGRQAADLPPSRHEWVTASLKLRPGYSGGPMVDSRGRLVGLNTIMAGLGVGLAVPTHVIVAFLRDRLRAAA